MLKKVRPRLTYANVMVTVLTFVVLGGGTAIASFVINSNADVAPNTISGHVPPAGDHANLITGSVGSGDLASGSVLTAKVAADAITGAKVLNKSLTSADLRDVGSLQAKTVRLSTGGGGALFTIGRVRLGSFCTNNSGTLSAGIEPAVSETGPVLVSGSSMIALQPFDVQFVVIVGDTTNVAARETSFAILDTGHPSASGVAAALVDPANGKCEVTVQAVG
jgi:hypothetical protein